MAHQRGYGIGLAYTKYIIEAHGGNISVESIPGKGSLLFANFHLNDFLCSKHISHIALKHKLWIQLKSCWLMTM